MTVHRTCQVFVESKDRICNRTVNADYTGSVPRCLFHQTGPPPAQRTFCDQCTSFINTKSFETHRLKKCPAVTRRNRIRSQEFFDEGRNESSECDTIMTITTNISTLDDRILALLPRCQAFMPNPCALALTPAMKHGRQHDAIIGKLREIGAIRSDTAIVELGAGKADLTEAIVEQFSLSKDSVAVAVDMNTFRHPADCRLRRSVKFLRAFINIRDFNMCAVDLLRDHHRIVCISKHLCGAGFDFALRCIVNETNRVSAIAMAPCCHHKCEWDQLVGRELLPELGFSKEDFEEMCIKSSWATRVGGNPDQYVIGYICKWIINSCRVRYLSDNGFLDAMCDRYVDPGCTPENMLIYGTITR